MSGNIWLCLFLFLTMLSVCEEKWVQICRWSPWFNDDVPDVGIYKSGGDSSRSKRRSSESGRLWGSGRSRGSGRSKGSRRSDESSESEESSESTTDIWSSDSGRWSGPEMIHAFGSSSGSKSSRRSDDSSDSEGSRESTTDMWRESSEESSGKRDSSGSGKRDSRGSGKRDSRGSGRRRFSRGILFDRGEEEYEEVELLEDARLHADFPENCEVPSDIHCRTVDTHDFANQTGDDVTCEAETGLVCRKRDRHDCHDYEVRYLCCMEVYTVTCETTPGISITSRCLSFIGLTSRNSSL